MDTHDAEQGGVERGGDRPGEGKRSEAALARQARTSGEDRDMKVANAVRKLVTSEIDGAAEVQDTAKQLLATDFLSA